MVGFKKFIKDKIGRAGAFGTGASLDPVLFHRVFGGTDERPLGQLNLGEAELLQEWVQEYVKQNGPEDALPEKFAGLATETPQPEDLRLPQKLGSDEEYVRHVLQDAPHLSNDPITLKKVTLIAEYDPDLYVQIAARGEENFVGNININFRELATKNESVYRDFMESFPQYSILQNKLSTHNMYPEVRKAILEAMSMGPTVAARVGLAIAGKSFDEKTPELIAQEAKAAKEGLTPEEKLQDYKILYPDIAKDIAKAYSDKKTKQVLKAFEREVQKIKHPHLVGMAGRKASTPHVAAPEVTPSRSRSSSEVPAVSDVSVENVVNNLVMTDDLEELAFDDQLRLLQEQGVLSPDQLSDAFDILKTEHNVGISDWKSYAKTLPPKTSRSSSEASAASDVSVEDVANSLVFDDPDDYNQEKWKEVLANKGITTTEQAEELYHQLAIKGLKPPTLLAYAEILSPKSSRRSSEASVQFDISIVSDEVMQAGVKLVAARKKALVKSPAEDHLKPKELANVRDLASLAFFESTDGVDYLDSQPETVGEFFNHMREVINVSIPGSAKIGSGKESVFAIDTPAKFEAALDYIKASKGIDYRAALAGMSKDDRQEAILGLQETVDESPHSSFSVADTSIGEEYREELARQENAVALKEFFDELAESGVSTTENFLESVEVIEKENPEFDLQTYVDELSQDNRYAAMGYLRETMPAVSTNAVFQVGSESFLELASRLRSPVQQKSLSVRERGWVQKTDSRIIAKMAGVVIKLSEMDKNANPYKVYFNSLTQMIKAGVNPELVAEFREAMKNTIIDRMESQETIVELTRVDKTIAKKIAKIDEISKSDHTVSPESVAAMKKAVIHMVRKSSLSVVAAASVYQEVVQDVALTGVSKVTLEDFEGVAFSIVDEEIARNPSLPSDTQGHIDKVKKETKATMKAIRGVTYNIKKYGIIKTTEAAKKVYDKTDSKIKTAAGVISSGVKKKLEKMLGTAHKKFIKGMPKKSMADVLTARGTAGGGDKTLLQQKQQKQVR